MHNDLHKKVENAYDYQLQKLKIIWSFNHTFGTVVLNNTKLTHTILYKAFSFDNEQVLDNNLTVVIMRVWHYLKCFKNKK